MDIDDEWRISVDRALAEKGHNKRWLSTKVKCNPSSISDLLKRGKKMRSALARPVSELLGIHPPKQASSLRIHPDTERLAMKIDRLRSEDASANRQDFPTVEALVDALLNKTR